EVPMTKTPLKHSGETRNARPKSKQPKTARSTARKPTSRQIKLPRPAASTPTTSNKKERSDTKQARVIAMLCGPAGATIDQMVGAPGWQHTSGRVFLPGVVP